MPNGRADRDERLVRARMTYQGADLAAQHLLLRPHVEPRADTGNVGGHARVRDAQDLARQPADKVDALIHRREPGDRNGFGLKHRLPVQHLAVEHVHDAQVNGQRESDTGVLMAPTPRARASPTADPAPIIPNLGTQKAVTLLLDVVPDDAAHLLLQRGCGRSTVRASVMPRPHPTTEGSPARSSGRKC